MNFVPKSPNDFERASRHPQTLKIMCVLMGALYQDGHFLNEMLMKGLILLASTGHTVRILAEQDPGFALLGEVLHDFDRTLANTEGLSVWDRRVVSSSGIFQVQTLSDPNAFEFDLGFTVSRPPCECDMVVNVSDPRLFLLLSAIRDDPWQDLTALVTRIFPGQQHFGLHGPFDEFNT